MKRRQPKVKPERKPMDKEAARRMNNALVYLGDWHITKQYFAMRESRHWSRRNRMYRIAFSKVPLHP